MVEMEPQLAAQVPERGIRVRTIPKKLLAILNLPRLSGPAMSLDPGPEQFVGRIIFFVVVIPPLLILFKLREWRWI